MRKMLYLILILCLAGCLPDRTLQTPDNVVEAFKRAGLEVGVWHYMLPYDYGQAPRVADAAIRFYIPSLCADCGGRIFVFTSLEDLLSTQQYYDNLGQGNPSLASWLFVKGNILVQINRALPGDQARKYEQALYSDP